MLRSNRPWERRLFYRLWIILFLFFTVSYGRRYDKCVTRDGRQGVCVVKRYCREASHQELLKCERDEENYCCPIPTTPRSAMPSPLEVPEAPRADGKNRPEPEMKEKRPEVFRGPEPPRSDDKYRPEPEMKEKRPEVFRGPETPRSDDKYRPEPEIKDKRPEVFPGPDRPRTDVKYRPEPPEVKEKRPEVYRDMDRDDRLNKTPPPADRRPPARHGSDRPKKRPSADKAEEHDNERRRPYDPQGNTKVVPERPRNVPHNRPSIRPAENDRRERPVARPDADRFYPAKDVFDSARATSPPKRTNPDKVPERRNRTEEDPSKAPIRFPEPYEFSVPRPKVPACGVKPYELFIAGGQESGEHEWPWMTAIFRRYPDSRPKTFLCGGSLINTKYVLTAAHCFVNNYVILPASSFVVRLGSHFLDSGEEYTVSNLVIHHNHSGSDFFNDIALVRLASEVYITDKIAPICLPYPELIRNDLVGRLATVAGWGDTAFRTGGTRILQHVTVPIVSGDECFAAYSRVRGAAFLARGSDHVICAGLREGGKDACLGDSGGPLMMRMPDDRWMIIGIVSLGYKCAEPGYPGVYTRVTHYMSWINTNMKRY